MIEIKANLKEYSIKAKGHADYDEKGKDIVCSAVSILFYTLAQTLIEYEAILDKEPDIDIKQSGEMSISCKPKDGFEGNINLIFFTILNGLQLLADGYKDNISLTVIQ